MYLETKNERHMNVIKKHSKSTTNPLLTQEAIKCKEKWDETGKTNLLKNIREMVKTKWKQNYKTWKRNGEEKAFWPILIKAW